MSVRAAMVRGVDLAVRMVIMRRVGDAVRLMRLIVANLLMGGDMAIGVLMSRRIGEGSNAVGFHETTSLSVLVGGARRRFVPITCLDGAFHTHNLCRLKVIVKRLT